MEKNYMQQQYTKMILFTTFYGLFFTILLYDNFSGITMPLFISGSIVFFSKIFKQMGKNRKKILLFLEISLCLISFSSFLSGNEIVHVLNVFAMIILFLTYLLFYYHDEANWDIPDWISNCTKTIFGTIASYLKPLTDYFSIEKQKEGTKEGNKTLTAILTGILIAIPFVWLILSLLSQADIVFDTFLERFKLNISFSEDIVGWIIYFFFSFLSSYGVLSYLTNKKNIQDKGIRNHGNAITAITVTSILALIYGIFSIIQIVYLFLGQGTLPDGVTYAAYAREGFFQLVFVCAINVILVLIGIHFYNKHKVLNGILSLISIFTYCMIFSSFYRMILYIQAYSLTFLRVFVLWCLVLLFCMMSLLLISIWKKEFPLLKSMIILVTSLFLVLSFMKPDYWIASYQCGQLRENQGSKVDIYYLTSLSSDAAYVIKEYQQELIQTYPEEEQEAVKMDLDYYFDKLEKKADEQTVRTFNLSVYLADYK